VVLETSLSPMTLTEAAGLVEVGRRSAEAHWGVRFEPIAPLESFAALGFGVVDYSIVGEAAPDFVGRRAHHFGLALSARAGTLFWLSSQLGTYVSVATSVAPNAPAVRVEQREIALLDRPLMGLSVGIAGRL
jgi:hypothetical protein